MSLQQHSQPADQEFGDFKRKIKAAYGLDLESYKRQQMERRLRANMEKCGAGSFGQYFSLLRGDTKLRDEFLDRLTINVSELFRNPDQFDTLRSSLLPELLRAKSSLSVWSAGCSHGAEPYTLAMLLHELAPNAGHTILATDIDDRMLARAKAGVFQESEMRAVSSQRVARYFSSGSEGYAAGDKLKKWLIFRKHDLLGAGFPNGFDLILCRNVVIYFTDEAKSELYRRFHGALSPGGYLFVGGTERIRDATRIGFENPMPFFYRKVVSN